MRELVRPIVVAACLGGLAAGAAAKPAKKPKPMKAKVVCYATKDDDRIDLPDKEKKSLDGYKVECGVLSTDDRFFGGDKIKVWGHTEYVPHSMNDAPTKTVSDPRAGTYADGEDETSYIVSFTDDDIPVCLDTFDIKIVIDDLSGAHLFTKSITVKQHC